jgi:sulfite reductase (NADPH) flavoprotein alpha-component
MWRKAHRWPSLVLGLVIIFLSITGAVLSVDPLLKRMIYAAPVLEGRSLADVLALTEAKNPHFQIDRLRVDSTGRVMLRGEDNSGNREVAIDLTTGRLGRVDKPSPVMQLVRDLHRSFAMDAPGRVVALIGALGMFLLLVSGAVLLARRLGGWRRLASPLRGRGLDRWHAMLARLVFVPLLVTVFTGVWMGLVTQGLLPSGVVAGPVPETRTEAPRVPATALTVFAQFPLEQVKELSFPIPSDWFDVYTIKTADEVIYIDCHSGEILARAPLSFWAQVLALFVLLHTGEGAAVWGAIAGIFVLSVPFFTVTGVILWLRRRHPLPRGMVRAALADVAILVGSETGTTWGFAAHLAGRLHAAGLKVHLGPMNSTPTLRGDASLILLAATYGDGAPPASASQFLTRLPAITGAARFAVLGFGDKAFAAYCAFGAQVDAALQATDRAALLPMADVNRRSAQAFAAWGRNLGAALGVDLVLDYAPKPPATRALTLTARQDFGAATGTPSAILTFAAPRRFGRYAAGDLLAVLPAGETVARLYSLASGRRDGMVQICVSKVEGGLCSNLMLGLALGDSVQAHVQANPDFRPARRAATIMIGAGTGVAPFAGMIRANKRGPIDLFFGLRHPDSDFYYAADFPRWQQAGQMTQLTTAVSRPDAAPRRAYVQDRLRDATDHLRARLNAGATVMVCGSGAMATAVAQEIDIIAQSLGSSVSDLRKRGRYLEDIY